MNFFNPWGFLGLLGVPLILLMYILKDKHKQIKVPSTFLWKKTINNFESKKPWQKLMKNIIMFLQIMTIIFISFALANPYITNNNSSAHYIFVLDTSASMSTLDRTQTRLEYSKNEIKKIVDDSPPNTYFSLITAKKDTDVIIEHISNKDTFKKIVSDVEQSFEKLDSNLALETINSFKLNNDGNIYFFTDSNLNVENVNDIQVISVKNSNENVGISLISESNKSVLVKLENNSSKEQNRTITLYDDNNILDVYEINIDANSSKDVYFDIEDISNINILKAVITPEDNYTYDDRYYYTLNENVNKKAIIFSDDNIFIEKVLSVLPNIEIYKGQKDFINNTNGYSLYIYDNMLPDKLPTDGHIMIFSPPENNNIINVMGEKDIVQNNLKVIDSPITRNINNINFSILKTKNIEVPLWADTFIESDETPLAFYGINNTNKFVVFGFDIYNTDIPLKMEFPILIYNSMNYFFPEKNIHMKNIFTGDNIDISLMPDTEEAYIVKPSGKQVVVAPPFPLEIFKDTNEEGVYKLYENNGMDILNESLFAVNIVRDFKNDINIDHNNVVNDNNIKKVSSTDKSIFGIFIIIIIIILLLEWWVNCNEN